MREIHAQCVKFSRRRFGLSVVFQPNLNAHFCRIGRPAALYQ
jgi:hypothetical protein